jgi:hypothetical protein
MKRLRQRLLLGLMLVYASAAIGTTTSSEPRPPVAPPAGSISITRDPCANFWTLAPLKDQQRRLLVLPAQAPTTWVDPQIAGLAPDAWRTIAAHADGYIWLSRPGRTVRFDPRKPEADVVEDAMSAARPGPWREVARMPASNHDLTAAVLNDRFYIAGGLTGDWGFPARSHAFDELWELHPRTWQWRVAARLARQRIYCATAAFAGKVWIIGGDVIEPDGTRYAVTTIELYDPRTGKLEPGVASTQARPMPLALAANGRLYVMGNPRGQFDNPGLMESIGAGENVWRREPDGPAGMGPLSGTTLDGKLYVVVPKTSLAVFDAKAGRWEMINAPAVPRSCQMAAYRGEIWMMGGRDITDLSQTLIFNPRTRAWRHGPSLPKPLSWGAAEVVGNRLIVTGGAAERSATERTWIYNDRTFVLHE